MSPTKRKPEASSCTCREHADYLSQLALELHAGSISREHAAKAIQSFVSKISLLEYVKQVDPK